MQILYQNFDNICLQSLKLQIKSVTVMVPACSDCNPGFIPRLLGCVQPGEEVALSCAILSLLASIFLAFAIVFILAASFYFYTKIFNRLTTSSSLSKKVF